MPTLHIEHSIMDFDLWNGAFERFAEFREQSGVRGHRLQRPVDDPNYVVIDLEFDDLGEADAYLAALQRAVYSSQEASPAVGSAPQTRIVEVVEMMEY